MIFLFHFKEIYVMLIDSITNFSNQEYSRQDTEHICVNCNHSGNCPGNCKTCLKEIHYPAEYPAGKKDYDCPNLINFYVCDYTFKYASEIWYLLKQSQVIKTMDEYKIVSIGCGACPDLMAFESYLNEQNISKSISYIGIDKNELWEPVHNEIKRYDNANIKTKFFYHDAFDLFKRKKASSQNILVLQYVISHLYNTEQITKLHQLYNDLISNIVLYKESGKPFVILINDVNSNRRGRDYFEMLCKKLTEANLHGCYSKYYFDYNIICDLQRFGTKHESTNILYSIPPAFKKYQPWMECSSAQMIIEIYGD